MMLKFAFGRGAMIHLRADVATLTTAKEFKEVEKPRVEPFRVHKIEGKLQNIGSHSPDAWFRALDRKFVDWNDDFVLQNGATWNSKANCQQFARFMALKLGLKYPQGVTIGGDYMPDIIDWVLYGMPVAQVK